MVGWSSFHTYLSSFLLSPPLSSTMVGWSLDMQALLDLLNTSQSNPVSIAPVLMGRRRRCILNSIKLFCCVNFIPHTMNIKIVKSEME
jgi:hypothetical protein